MAVPDPTTDAELLRAWSCDHCQASFKTLVGKYLSLVHGVALRRTGDPDLAQDIAQRVFIITATKAARLKATPSLASWLHHCAWCETLSALRRESTRQRHMHQYTQHVQAEPAVAPASGIHAALPLLDEALQTLPGNDRQIVLMRYYEGHGLEQIARALSKSEAAVRKQCQRALEKLQIHLSRRGFSTSTAILASGLGPSLCQPSSAAIVLHVSTTATAAAAVAPTTTFVSFLSCLVMNSKLSTALLTATCLSIPLVWQWQRAESLAIRVSELEQDISAAATAKSPATASIPSGRNLWSGSGNSGGSPAGTASGLGPHLSANEAAERRKRLDGPDRAAALTDRAHSILSERNPARRLKLFSLFMDELRPGDYEAINAGFARQDQQGRLFGPEYELFLASAGTVDGQATMDSIFKWIHPTGGSPTGAHSGAMSSWAMEEPAQAIAWWNAQEEGHTKNELAKSLISGLAVKDIQLAWACLNEFPAEERAPFMGSLVRQQINDLGAGGAASWLADLHPPDQSDPSPLKQQGFHALYRSLVNLPPDQKSSFINQFADEPWMTETHYAAETAGQWAAKNGPAAIDWAAALPDALRTGALGTALNEWSQTQPQEFLEWQAANRNDPVCQEALSMIRKMD